MSEVVETSVPESVLKDVFVGKALVKLGADDETLRIVEAMLGRIGFDHDALKVAVSLPAIWWSSNGHEDIQVETHVISTPERVFGVLEAIGLDAEARHIAAQWVERVGMDEEARRIVLEACERCLAPILDTLTRSRQGRTSFSPLEGVLAGLLVFQVLFMTTWILGKRAAMINPVPPPLVSVPAPVAPVVPESPPVIEVPVSAPVAAVPATVSVPVPEPKVASVAVPKPQMGDLVYYSGGKVKLQWASLGSGYRYRVYSSKNGTMKNSIAVNDQSTAKTEWLWTKTADTDYLAIKAIDASGQESPFSEATYVSLY